MPTVVTQVQLDAVLDPAARTVLTALDAAIGSLQSDSSDLEARVDALEGDVGASPDLDTLRSDVAGLQTSVATLASSVTSLQAGQHTHPTAWDQRNKVVPGD